MKSNNKSNPLMNYGSAERIEAIEMAMENVDLTKPHYRCKACGEIAMPVTEDVQCACERSEPLKGEMVITGFNKPVASAEKWMKE